MKSDGVFRLGAFQFDRKGPTLRDRNGVVLPLRHQSLKVLDQLCQNAGQIVTKAVLYERVWGDTFVTDASLVQCIREIRRALEDTDFSVVKTFPRQGYLIEVSQPDVPNGDNEPDAPVIAVCEFQNRSPGTDQHALADEIAEDLIVALSRYPEMSVVSRQASFGFKAEENRTEHIVRRTGAQYILTGYQKTSGQNLSIGVSLIDASTDKNIWSEIYDLDSPEPHRSQREIVEKIANALEYLIPSFSPKAGGAGKAAALGYHLRARTEFMKFTEDSLVRAEKLGLKAIKADPSSAYGYLSLCFVHLCRHEFGLWHNQPEEDLEAADKHAETALSLAPNSPNAVMARGVVFMNQGKLEDAIACFEKTMLLNPYYSANRMNYSEALALIGDIPAALEQVELSRARNGVRPGWHYQNTAFILWVAGQTEDAVDYLRNEPNMPLTGIPFKCALLASNGDVSAARAEMAKFTAKRPNHTLAIERFVVEKKFRDRKLADQWLAALELAGMPTHPPNDACEPCE